MQRRLLDDQAHPDTSERLEEIRQAVRLELGEIMNAVPTDASTIDDQIRSWLKDQRVTVIHDSFNGSEFILVGYSIRHGGSAIPDAAGVIEAYRKAGTRYEWTASATGGWLDGYTVRLEKLPSPWSTELWVLARGQQTLVMQYHEKMAIYSFNGTELRGLWTGGAARRDASYKIAGNSLFVAWDDESDGTHTWLTQKLYLTPGGVVESTPQLTDTNWKVATGTVERTDR